MIHLQTKFSLDATVYYIQYLFIFEMQLAMERMKKDKKKI